MLKKENGKSSQGNPPCPPLRKGGDSLKKGEENEGVGRRERFCLLSSSPFSQFSSFHRNADLTTKTFVSDLVYTELETKTFVSDLVYTELETETNSSTFRSGRLKLSPFFLLLVFFSCVPSNPPQITPLSRQDGVSPQIIATTQKASLLGVNYLFRIRMREEQKNRYPPSAGGIAVDVKGDIYVVDAENDAICVLAADGRFQREFGRSGWRAGEFDAPADIAINFIRDEFLYVVDAGNNRVQACNLTDELFKVVVGEKDSAPELSGRNKISLNSPQGIAVDRNGNLYIADTGNHRFLKINPQGKLLMSKGVFGWAAGQFQHPLDLVVDERKNIYVVDAGNHRIQKFDFSGNFLATWGEKGRQRGEFNEPRYIAKDKFDNIYIIDQGNRRIQVFDTDGNFLTLFETPDLITPMGIAIDKNDRVYVTDMTEGDIKVFKIVYRE